MNQEKNDANTECVECNESIKESLASARELLEGQGGNEKIGSLMVGMDFSEDADSDGFIFVKGGLSELASVLAQVMEREPIVEASARTALVLVERGRQEEILAHVRAQGGQGLAKLFGGMMEGEMPDFSGGAEA